MSSAYMKIDDVVKDILSIAYNDETDSNYARVARGVSRSLEDLHLNLFPQIRSTAIVINENFTADLPDDCVFVTKVGVCFLDRIRILGRDDTLCIRSDVQIQSTESCCDCPKPEDPTVRSPTDVSCPACTFHNFNAGALGLNGYSSNELYGYTPKQFLNGTYRTDHATNRLILSAGYDLEPGLSLVLEYKSSLRGKDYSMIPREAFNALYFRTMDLLNFEKNIAKSSQQNLRFKQEYFRLKSTYQSFSLEDFVAAFRNGYKSTPKR